MNTEEIEGMTGYCGVVAAGLRHDIQQVVESPEIA